MTYTELTAASLRLLFCTALGCISCRELPRDLAKYCRICAVQRPITSRQLGGHVSTADSAQSRNCSNVTRPFPASGWGLKTD